MRAVIVRPFPLLLSLAILLLLAPLAAQRRAAEPSISPQDLARLWDAERVSSPVSALVDHAEVVRRLNELSPDMFTVEPIGQPGNMPRLIWPWRMATPFT